MTGNSLLHPDEPGILSYYLTGTAPGDKEKELYSEAVRKLDICLSEKEKRIWSLMMKHPFLIGFIDAGLALTRSNSAIRHRIFMMLAILETSVKSQHIFSLENKQSAALFVLRCVAGMARSAIGILMVKLLL